MNQRLTRDTARIPLRSQTSRTAEPAIRPLCRVPVRPNSDPHDSKFYGHREPQSGMAESAFRHPSHSWIWDVFAWMERSVSEYKL